MSRKECWLSLIFEQESEKIKPEARVRESCPPLTYPPPPPPPLQLSVCSHFILTVKYREKRVKGIKVVMRNRNFLIIHVLLKNRTCKLMRCFHNDYLIIQD